MSYLSKILVILVSVVFLASCGLQQVNSYTDVSGYPYRYTDFDYKYAWKTVATDHGVVIDGYMKNTRYPYIDSVHMTVFVLGKDGKTIARASTFPMFQQTEEGDVSHFSLLLRDVKPVPGDVYEFLVHYTGDEGGNHSGVDWRSSFKVDAVTGALVRTASRNPDEW